MSYQRKIVIWTEWLLANDNTSQAMVRPTCFNVGGIFIDGLSHNFRKL